MPESITARSGGDAPIHKAPMQQSFRTLFAYSPAQCFTGLRGGCFSHLAGGVDTGYFALNAGDAGSNPALGASPGRLVAQDTSCSDIACSPA